MRNWRPAQIQPCHTDIAPAMTISPQYPPARLWTAIILSTRRHNRRLPTAQGWKRLSAQMGTNGEHHEGRGNSVFKILRSPGTTPPLPRFFNYKLDSAVNHALVLVWEKDQPARLSTAQPFLIYPINISYNTGNPYLNPVILTHQLIWI